jgi:hypothetical protein
LFLVSFPSKAFCGNFQPDIFEIAFHFKFLSF